MDKKRQLLRFIEDSPALDNNSKLKAILFITGAKPSTYIHLRIQKNLHDKHTFEEHLKKNSILFEVSKAKGYEEITAVKNNAAIWRIKGAWYGYDLFLNKYFNERFLEYIMLLKQQKHEQADKVGGQVYGYPTCCVNNFIQEHGAKGMKKYGYYEYYERLHDSDKSFPFIAHTPCSPKCKETKKLNKKYESAVKKWAPKFYKDYSKKKTYILPVIVDVESDIPRAKWKKKDGHDYVLVTQKPIDGKYYLISWLTKAAFKRGTILKAKITMQYDFAIVKALKKIGELKNFHHERKFTKL
jgi:hypothetical protein